MGKSTNPQKVKARMLRMAGRTSHWPKPYTAYIRLCDEKQGLEVRRQVAIMLPHAILLAMVEWCGDAD
eukprot:8472169-Karenia_brevis.AAC.1